MRNLYVLETKTHRWHDYVEVHRAYYADEDDATDAIETLEDAARTATDGNATFVYWELSRAPVNKLYTVPTVIRFGSTRVTRPEAKPRKVRKE